MARTGNAHPYIYGNDDVGLMYPYIRTYIKIHGGIKFYGRAWKPDPTYEKTMPEAKSAEGMDFFIFILNHPKSPED